MGVNLVSVDTVLARKPRCSRESSAIDGEKSSPVGTCLSEWQDEWQIDQVTYELLHKGIHDGSVLKPRGEFALVEIEGGEGEL